MQINPYIGFDGTCAEAFAFYEQALGATRVMMMTYGESPVASHMPPEAHDRIMHAQIKLGATTLMGGDVPPGQYKPMTGFYVSLVVDTPDQALQAFTALSQGGTIRMPLDKTFWSPAFGMLVDRFGTPWMVNCAPVG